MTHNAHAERARVLLDHGRADLAEAEVRQAIALAPEDGELHALLAGCCLDLGRAEEALAAADQAIGLAPHEYSAHWARTGALLRLERAEDAEMAARALLGLGAEHACSLGLLASALLAQGSWREAAAAAERGLALDPECEHCLQPRAAAMVQLGQFDAAQDLLEAAATRRPDHAGTHELLGFAALRRHDAKEAVHRYRESLRLNPTSASAQSGLLEAERLRTPLASALRQWFAGHGPRRLVAHALLVLAVIGATLAVAWLLGGRSR